MTFFGFIFNFAILFFLFRIFFYKPIKSIIDKREKEIQENLEQNQKLSAESQTKIADAQTQLHDAELQAKKIISESNDLATEIVQKAKTESKLQAREILLSAEEEIKSSMESSNQILKNQALRMTRSISHGVISSIMTYAMDCELIKKLILDLENVEVTEASGKIISFSTALNNAIQHKETIKVITAIELPWEIKEEMTKRISQFASQTVEIQFEKTKLISGGFKLNFGYTDLDFSIEGQISSIIRQLS